MDNKFSNGIVLYVPTKTDDDKSLIEEVKAFVNQLTLHYTIVLVEKSAAYWRDSNEKLLSQTMFMVKVFDHRGDFSKALSIFSTFAKENKITHLNFEKNGILSYRRVY